MKVLFDSSVLVAGMVQSHPAHARALPWLERAWGGEIEFIVAAHSLAELYAVLTTLPVKPRISPGLAWRLIEQDVTSKAKILALTAAEYAGTVKTIADLGLTGGAVYDALIVRVAEKASVDHLLTLDIDFKRVWPGGLSRVLIP